MTTGELLHESDTLKKRIKQPARAKVPAAAAAAAAVPFSDEKILDSETEDDRKARLRTPAPHKNKWIAFCHAHRDTLIPLSLTLLAFWTRLYRITESNIVVWDEAHFGKFASHYLKRDFYFDVHPPLGKILVALGGVLAGYRGRFEFKSGEKYPEDMHYGVMRVFLALFGIAVVPLAYLTARELRLSRRASFLAGWMILFDTAYMAISRFILLDSMLLCFTCTTVYCLTRFHNERKRPFSDSWYLWLFLTGVNIGIVCSIKWVGFFVMALVGMQVLEDLWDLFGDLRLPKLVYVKHWAARAVCLIAVPAAIYIWSFWLHFLILNMSGPGDAQMSSLFQAGLEGNKFHENPLMIAYGSRITLKNNGYGGGLLHSHVQTYPSGSKQQQVTCYHHKDNNNNWVVRRPRDAKISQEGDEVQYVKEGDVIRLVHANTGRNLHSHPFKAPVTTSQWEVSGYGNDTVGDSNDYWRVEIVDDLYEGRVETVRSLTTRIRLRHVPQGCLLRSHGVNLPQWGFKQAEVICDRKNDLNSPNNIWNVEQHWNEMLPPGNRTTYKSKFFKDFIDLNVAMMTSNNALVPDQDKDDILTSSPWQWPFATVGLRMCSWADDVIKYYLLGSPAVWWSASSSLIAFAGLLLYYVLRMQRKYRDWHRDEWSHFIYVGKTLAAGWLLHYIPFCIMGRVTYLHHYFPALYFSVLMVPFLMDHAASRLQMSDRRRQLMFCAVAAVVFGVFWWFSPVAFGMNFPISQLKGRKWLSTWNIVD